MLVSDILQTWLRSGACAVLDGISLLPRVVGADQSVPVVIESEEGVAYALVDDCQQGWILKKFLPGQAPARAYTDAVQRLIPRAPGFNSGFNRRILSHSSVSPTGYCSDEFKSWIDGTILMPQVTGPTWTEFANVIRHEAGVLLQIQRLSLCLKLSVMVDCLEAMGLAHRDLSSNNVLVDPENTELHLVDWDNLYHATLPMPSNSAFGTNGYLAPFRMEDDPDMNSFVWEERADRFALAVLNSEFLAIQTGSACVEDGGLLQQNDIDNRDGPTLHDVRKTLRESFPEALALLDQALNASSFARCPGPIDWMRFAVTSLSNRVW
jgi:serine/threonine protein kinase